MSPKGRNRDIPGLRINFKPLKLTIMKTYNGTSLTNFEFRSGAKDHKFTYYELKDIESVLEDIYTEGCSETQINNLFWHEEEWLCESIGIDYEADYLKRG